MELKFLGKNKLGFHGWSHLQLLKDLPSLQHATSRRAPCLFPMPLEIWLQVLSCMVLFGQVFWPSSISLVWSGQSQQPPWCLLGPSGRRRLTSQEKRAFLNGGAGTFLCFGLIPKPALEDDLKTILGFFSRGFTKGWQAAFGDGGALAQPHGMRTGTCRRALTDEDR